MRLNGENLHSHLMVKFEAKLTRYMFFEENLTSRLYI